MGYAFTKYLWPALATAALSACAGQGSSDPSSPPTQSSERVNDGLTATPDDGPGETPPARQPEQHRPVTLPTVEELSVTPADAPEGEDGRGQLVPATASAVNLDVRAESWPGRALDPVLHVGEELQFSRYRHPEPGVLRFVAADGSTLPQGEVVYIQWGDDVSSRIEVTSSLEVPR